MITLAIAGCAKGGLTSSMKNNKLNVENLPAQTLPVDTPSEPISDIDNPKNNPTTASTIEAPKPPTNPDLGMAKQPPPSKPVKTKPMVTPSATKQETIVPPPAKPAITVFNFLPLVWEKTVKAAKEWSNMIYTIIKKEEPNLLGSNIADDIEIFCPTYRALDEKQRLNFWGQFFAALAMHESGWNPTSQFVEKNISSKDSITKKQVVSEGLLQLSYQDQKNYPFDCGFDWSKDNALTQKDPTKTILNPYLNLRCGIKILTYQLKKYGRITLEKNVYWAVLKTNGKYSKIKEISKTTRALKICQ